MSFTQVEHHGSWARSMAPPRIALVMELIFPYTGPFLIHCLPQLPASKDNSFQQNSSPLLQGNQICIKVHSLFLSLSNLPSRYCQLLLLKELFQGRENMLFKMPHKTFHATGCRGLTFSDTSQLIRASLYSKCFSVQQTLLYFDWTQALGTSRWRAPAFEKASFIQFMEKIV